MEQTVSLDDAGNLVDDTPMPSRGWVQFVSRHHLSYLILNVQGNLASYIRERQRIYNCGVRRRFDTDGKLSLSVFRKLLRRWKHLVESNGSVFRVMSVLDAPIDPSVVTIFSEENVKVIDLFDCVSGFDPRHSQRPWQHSPYRFKNDKHWNEAGNCWAAVCLYRVLEEEMRLPARTEADLRTALDQYYAAFGGRIFTNFGWGRGGSTGDHRHSREISDVFG